MIGFHLKVLISWTYSFILGNVWHGGCVYDPAGSLHSEAAVQPPGVQAVCSKCSLLCCRLHTMELRWIVIFSQWCHVSLTYSSDNHQCPGISYIRSSLPAALQPATQLHAWWHLLAGYASYLNIQHCVHHRLTYLKRPVTISRDWIGTLVTVDSPREKA